MICKNGQTQKISGRFNSGDIFDQPKGLGRVSTPGGIYGLESIRPDPVDSSEENSSGATKQRRNVAPGKILERLKLIEDRYLSHLNTVQQHLESLLNQNKGESLSLKSAIQEIEREIYDLVSNSQNLLEPPSNETMAALISLTFAVGCWVTRSSPVIDTTSSSDR